MDKLDAFSQNDFDEEFAFLFETLTIPPEIKPLQQPKAVLLGGQSGSGKTLLHRIAKARFDANVIVVNGDEYRSSHPNFQKLNEKYGSEAVSHFSSWSGAMTEALVDSFSDRKYNLVIEGTLRTSEVPLKTAAGLKEKGYSVELALMAVKPEISLISCQLRYEQMRIAGTTPRATDPKHHRMIVDAIVDNLSVLEESKMFDRISLYDRQRTRLFPLDEKLDDNLSEDLNENLDKTPDKQLSKNETNENANVKASDILREVLFGAWTEEEKLHYEMLQQELERLKAVD